MLKRITLAIAALLLTSCGQTKFAEQYASRMANVLKMYRDQVDAKIAAEQQSYVDLARIYDEANSQRLGTAILLERDMRATEMVDRLAREKAASHSKVAWISEVHNDLRTFAEFDFEQSHTLFTRELDAYKASLAGLADLSQEQSDLDKLKDSLESLAKPQSIGDRLRAGAEFGCEVNRNYQLLDVTQKIEDLTGKIANETDADKKKSLETQRSNLENQKQKLETPCSVG